MMFSTSLSHSGSTRTNSIQPDNITHSLPTEKRGKIFSHLDEIKNTSESLPLAEKKDKDNEQISFLGYPKIKQYYNVVSEVRKSSSRINKNEKPPIVNFHGTVKLHGTNCSVAHDYETKQTWPQSRNFILSTDKTDNKGFAAYAKSDDANPIFENIFTAIHKHRAEGENRVAIYGEWCGKDIQKNVAISELSPMFVVFNIALYNESGKYRWMDPAVMHEIITEARGKTEFSKNLPIYSTEDFETWDISVDFSDQKSIDSTARLLAEHTTNVEGNCPVGKKFGISGCGEGIVWKSQVRNEQGDKNSAIQTDNLMFKVKGQKHSETHVKTLVPVSAEMSDSINQFIENTVTEKRLENVMDKLSASEMEVKTFCLKVKADVLSEESLSIAKSKLNKKSIVIAIDERASKWFKEKVNDG
ncbi:RNA ligase family protein [Erwinia mallotivora]|uniref:RNA ligase family protein n=1 Tax=Erwinia mallotivora TaxID=69222 RepID=UPI0035E5D6FE